MTKNSDFDRHASAWLAGGPTELADRVLHAALREVHLTPQRRRWSAPWRTTLMSLRLGAAALIAIVAVAGILAFSMLGSGVGPPVGPSPSPTAQPTSIAVATPTPNPNIDTATWTTYVSNRYGFSIGRPPGWTLTQASNHIWTLAADHDWLSTASEGFTAVDGSVYATAWSVAVPAGTSADAWILAYCQTGATTPCTGLPAASIPVTMDGHPGVLIKTVDTEAFTLVGNWMYVVAVWESFDDPRTAPFGGGDQLVKGLLSTMRLLPGGPATPAPTTRPS